MSIEMKKNSKEIICTYEEKVKMFDTDNKYSMVYANGELFIQHLINNEIGQQMEIPYNVLEYLIEGVKRFKDED
jgi:hypothetical protein